MVKPEKAAPVTGTILSTTGPVQAESRRVSAIHTQSLGPMADGGAVNKQMYVAAEIGRHPVNKHQIQPLDNYQADAGRDGLTRLARPD